ncbi:MAG: hypothetical protein CMK09_13385 [Ponticaulis sp.]|nr:hypothetical protein [Ponticaulis sp.]|tara:strand:+ start:36675 stop:37457 length:783 start_codon:yes stop_codon:yes gene_type:complete
MADVQSPTPSDGKLDIMDVINTSVKVFTENAVVYLVLSAVLIGIPFLIYSLILVSIVGGGVSPLSGGFLVWSTLGSFVTMLFSLLLQATVIITAINQMNGRMIDFMAAINQALQHIVPLFILSILLAIGFTIGFALLVVPGILLMLIWAVVVPAYVAEDIEMMSAFGRSADLTKGQRLRILGLVVIVMLIGLAVSLVLGLVSGGSMMDPMARYTFAGAIFSTISQIVMSVLFTIGSAVLYLKLRYLKDGADVGSISSVFD